MGSNLIGLVGIGVILGIAYALSSNRKAINLRIVGAAFGLQAAMAAFVLYSDGGRAGSLVMQGECNTCGKLGVGASA